MWVIAILCQKKGGHMENYQPIRKWPCACVDCTHTTKNWFADHWLCTGLAATESRIETIDARCLLEDTELIAETDLTVAMICPECKPGIVEFLDELLDLPQAKVDESLESCERCGGTGVEPEPSTGPQVDEAAKAEPDPF